MPAETIDFLIDLQEQRGRKVPHHSLRRDVMDGDRPETVVRSLAAQIEDEPAWSGSNIARAIAAGEREAVRGL